MNKQKTKNKHFPFFILVDMQYSPLTDTKSTRGSISPIDQIDTNIQEIPADSNDYYCRPSKK